MAALNESVASFYVRTTLRGVHTLTTLAGWVGVDSRGPASLYLVSDSRITWNGLPNGGAKHWDNARKTFSSQVTAEIFGYAGDVLLPTQTIGQLIDLIDRGAVSLRDATREARLEWITQSLETSCRAYPSAAPRDFSLFYCGREGEGMNSTFYAFSLEFKNGSLAIQKLIEIPVTSGPLTYIDGKEHVALGSGRDGFKKCWKQWLQSDVGGTSRSAFSAFADHIKSRCDPYTGGPPQLVGIYRSGPARCFGVIWNGRRFLGGMEVFDVSDEKRLNWHNDLFEICNPVTLRRNRGSQPQPRPRNV